MPEIGLAPQGGFDLELEKALLDDPCVDFRVSPATYQVPPIPVVSTDEPVYQLEAPPSRDLVSSPVRECSPPPCHMATMDQYLPRKEVPFEGESSDLASLPRPLTPRLLDEVVMVESTEDSTPGEPMTICAPCEPDLSREGPFDLYNQSSGSGTSLWCWTACLAVHTG